MLMGRDVKTISVERHSGSPDNRLVHVGCVRESDNKRSLKKCRGVGNRVIWVSDMPNEGYHLWRDDIADEKIKFARHGKGSSL